MFLAESSHADSRKSVPPSMDHPRLVDPARVAALADHPTAPTIFDHELARIPLKPHEDHSFLDRHSTPYLFPRLSKNERNRLTAVWYYTKGLDRDREFLAHIQETLDLLKEMIVPFDAVFIGIMDKDVYTQVVSTDSQLAKFTRREAVCGHTINQPSGTVLYLPDMRLDPHFAGSPLVTDAGLVSYVGAPLRFTCERIDGTREEIVLGGLCATSCGKSGPILDQQQHRLLVRFADLIAHDIVERAKKVRLLERHRMDARIFALSEQAKGDNALDIVIASLRETYPEANVSIQTRPDDTIGLIGTDAVPFDLFVHGLWEATDEVDMDIRDFNHLPVSARPWDQALRAIAVQCPGISHIYLVVQTPDLAHVFDEIDVSLVRDCAHILDNINRAATAERITHAAFFRDFSTELRLPIHAILRSCEQLVESMRGMGFSSSSSIEPAKHVSSDHSTLLNNTLASGHKLLNTVNTLLGTSDVGAPAVCISDLVDGV